MYLSTSIMAEITNSEEWLKAATHCVLEHWCDADAWLWNVPEGKLGRTNTQRWKGFEIWRVHFDHYDWQDPVHMAVYNALMFHLEPEVVPKTPEHLNRLMEYVQRMNSSKDWNG